MAPTPPSGRDDFEVAVICALSIECNAVSLLFDEFWDQEGDKYGRASGDPNHYTTGRVGKYNVVLALLPHMGTIDAASAAASMRSSYRALKLALLVGVCGGVPQGEHGEVLLGDVIISKSVVQYDFGRQYPDQFVRKDTIGDSLGRPNKDIRSLLTWFETDRGIETLERRTADFLQQLQANAAKSKRASKDKYRYPGAARDQLFRADYRHKHYLAATCICRDCLDDTHPVCDATLDSSCDDLGCDENQLVVRARLGEKRQLEREDSNTAAQAPALHVGAVASGNMVIKSAAHRDKIASKEKVIAFEMEGAGIWDEVPCIVVKGVCDYADSHKHKGWQNFAAATAASAAKAILERYVQTDKPLEATGNDHTTRNDMSRAAHHDRPGADAQGPVFHGPITGRNVIAGSSTTGGTVQYIFK